MTTATTEYPAYLVPGEEAREHPELSPTFDDGTAPADGTDPEAPWGRKADGSPRAKPGRPKGTPDGAPRTRTAQRKVRIAAAAPKPRAKAAGAPKAKGPDYRPGIKGIMQVVAAPLMMAGMKNPAFAADAAAITVHADPIADAMQASAEAEPRFAAVLDRILTVGPYGALLAATMPLAAQILANHRVIPPAAAEAMGAMAPDALMQRFVDEMPQAA